MTRYETLKAAVEKFAAELMAARTAAARAWAYAKMERARAALAAHVAVTAVA